MKPTILKTLFFSVIASSSLFAQKYDLIGTIEQQNPTCYGQANGSISVTAFGGTEPYSYSWSTGDTTASISNLAAGTYTITIYDLDSNMITSSIDITEPNEIVLNGTITNVSSNAGNDGQISIIASGLLPSFTFDWYTTNGSGLSMYALDQSNLIVGDYTLTVTNPLGCSASKSFHVAQQLGVFNEPLIGFANFNPSPGHLSNAVNSVYPNPSMGEVTILAGSKYTKIQIFDSYGQQVKLIERAELEQSDIYTEQLDKGTYFVHFSRKNETPTIQTLIIR